MNGTHDREKTEPDRDERGLDPHAAARLLEQTQRRAQSGLDFRSPSLSLLAAALTLIAFGAVWLSVRAQHPYTGPTPESLAVLYAVVLIRIGSVAVAHQRATTGITGHSLRRRRAEAAGLTVAAISVYVVMGALAHAGASDAVVYGVYTVTASLLVPGTFWAGRSSAREDWPQLGVAVAIIVVAAASAFAGPRGVWLGDGLGCCVVLLGLSAYQAWRLHAVRPDA